MRKQAFMLAITLLLTGFVPPVWADAASADKLLTEKGLKKVKPYFVLEGEQELSTLLRDGASLRKKVFEAQKKAEAADAAVEEKKRLITTYLQQRRELRAQLEQTTNINNYNKLVTAMNELLDRIALMERSEEYENAAKVARAASAQASEEFTEYLLKAERVYKSVKERYADLAADSKVAEAIAEISKAEDYEYKLGPGRVFLSSGKKLEVLLDQVLSGTIEMRHGAGDLWYVQVMFNGEHAQELSVDTGSSVISLPYAMAKAMDMEPGSSDPVVQLQLADGRIIEAHKKIAAKVRVGRFTVESVECAVLPPHCTEAEPLLGMSFLQHFNYKIDTNSGKLTMSRIDTGSNKVSAAEGEDEPGEPEGAETLPEEEPAPAGEPKDREAEIERLAKLLKSSDGKGVMLILDNQLSMFQPARSGPAAKLKERIGEPDKVADVPSPKADQQGVKWQVWKWGKLQLLVDNEGAVRYMIYPH